MIKQYNIYLDRETSFFSSKQCFDKSWGLWQIILRLRFLCGLSHMHGLNPYTFFSRASAATQPFENSVFQHTGYVPTRTTSMPWRKQFPTTRAKLHFTKQWGYAVGCCWFWTHRRLAGDSWGSILLPRFFLSSTHAGSCIVQDCELCLKLPSRSGGGPQRLWRPKAALQPLTSVGPGCGSVTIAQQQQRRHHLRGFGVALRNRLQPGAQFVSLSILSCEFFDCEILRTSQKFQVSIFKCYG